MESIFKPALLLMSGRFLAFAGTFLVPLVLVRVFDQAEFGTYKQLLLIYSTLFGIAQFGMAESLFYFLPSFQEQAGKYVANALFILAGVGAASLGILGLAREQVSAWLGNMALAADLLTVGLYLLFMITSAVLEIVMISRKRYFWASASYGISDLVRAAFLVVPALLFGELKWVILGGAAFGFVRLCATAWYLIWEFDGGLEPDRGLMKRQLAYALPFQMAVVVEILQANLHQYAVSYHFDAATFAIYAVGCLQVPLVELVFTSTGNVMMVRMSEEIRSGRGEAVLAIWNDIARKLALIFVPLVALLLVTARELIVSLFTETYRASVPVFMIWSLSILGLVLQTDGTLRVYAETRYLFLLNLIRLLLVAVSVNFFLGLFHLPGAALAAISADFIYRGLGLIRLKGLMRAAISQLLPWRSFVLVLMASAAAALPAWLVKIELQLPPLGLLITTSVVYAVSYLAILYRFLLTDDEKLSLINYVQRFALGLFGASDLKRG
ncbi:MAG: hypothetical protein HY695_20395 [Deltaproteobacteria bacterium]|nr:hypothetical protein [Deltaproteobacteria bacterium]